MIQEFKKYVYIWLIELNVKLYAAFELYLDIMKEKIYLGLSVLLLFALFFAIVSGDVVVGVLDSSLPFEWIFLLVFTMILPLLNAAEIIINRDSWNVFYWIGLLLNVIAIIFVMRFFKIEILY